MQDSITNEAIKYSTVSFHIDKKSNIVYFATKSGIYSYDGRIYSEIYNHKKNSYGPFNFKYLLSVNNDVYVTTDNNKIFILKNKKNWYKFSDVFPKYSPLADPLRMHLSDQNNLWIGSRSEGVMLINLLNNEVRKSSILYHPNALKKLFILSFYTSTDGSTWLGISGGGVAKYNNKSSQIELWRNEAVPLEPTPDNMILSIHSDNDEDFYMGTLTSGLLHTNIFSKKSSYYKPPKAQYNNTDAYNMYGITSGDDADLWIATWGGLVSFNKKTKSFTLYNDKDNKTLQLATVLRLKNSNKLIVGGYLCGLRMFDIGTKKWSSLGIKNLEYNNICPRFISQLNDNEILISSEGKSFFKYNFQTGNILDFTELKKIGGSARHHLITDSLWYIGTDNGLFVIDPYRNRVIKHYTKKDGLPDNVIYAVLKDNFDNLWLSSNSGLFIFNITTHNITKFDENEGLQSLEFNTASCFVDKSENLWFGGVNGMNKIPSNFPNIKIKSMTPLITEIQVMNENLISDTSVTFLRHFILEPNTNFVNFEYQSPNYSNAESTTYRYKLSPIDTGWINAFNRTSVNYAQLRSGFYKFEVQSSLDGVNWSASSASHTFEILTPWYKSWWSSLLALAAISLFAYLIVKSRFNEIEKQANFKHKLHETEMAALRAQMNPHFIFNCINSIDAFIQSNDKYNASLYLNKFAKLIRTILESSKNNVVPLEKDIEAMKLYIELEEIRSEGKFTTDFLVSEDLYHQDIKIPPLIIQPYIENAIIHGIRNKSDKNGILKINIFKDKNYLCYTIMDNGIGRFAASKLRKHKESSYGMQLSEDRISLFNECEGKVIISDLYHEDKPCGTHIEVKLKLD
jgi:ligand-binding sensor domain-containing protein/anti-sigma regulatory factor (Ser/Thr protein kinase)